MPTGNPNANICPYQSKSLLSGKRKKEILKEERKRKEERRARALKEEDDEHQRKYLENSIAAAVVSGRSIPLPEPGVHSIEPSKSEKNNDVSPSDMPVVDKSRANSKCCEQGSSSLKGKKKTISDLRSHFLPESTEELKIRLELAQTTINNVVPSVSQVDTNLGSKFVKVDLTDVGHFLPIPRRPAWSKDMNKDQLDASEEQYFSAYIQETQTKARDPKYINKFEVNLEVWRQLWRVGERSDILLVLADVRCPLFSFPLSLYDYVVQAVKKPIIVVLTKVDLLPEDLVLLWINWFRHEYPTVHVVPFSSHPKLSSDDHSKLVQDQDCRLKREKARKLRGTRMQIPMGINELESAIQRVIVNELCRNAVDFTPTHLMSTRELESQHLIGDELTEHNESNEGTEPSDDFDQHYTMEASASIFDRIHSQELNPDFDAADNRDIERIEIPTRDVGMVREATAITIGVIGLPNAGKSSFINALARKRVVSVSKTPGHTKHLQTIFLNKSLQLCDCPGLVFPVVGAAYPMQVLFGLINIAQVREVFTSLAFVAERIPLIEIYNLKPPRRSNDVEKVDQATTWSGLAIAEAWAEKRSYYTSKSRLDAHRAGNEILRDIVSGRVVFALAPPDLEAKLSAGAANNF